MSERERAIEFLSIQVREKTSSLNELQTAIDGLQSQVDKKKTDVLIKSYKHTGWLATCFCFGMLLQVLSYFYRFPASDATASAASQRKVSEPPPEIPKEISEPIVVRE